LNKATNLPIWLALAAALVVAAVLVVSGSRVPEAGIPWPEVASGAVFVVIVVAWIAIAGRVDLRPAVASLVQGGLLMVLLGTLAGVLEKIFAPSGLFGPLLKNVAFPLGMLLITVGFYQLRSDVARTLSALRGEKDLFEARSVSDAQTTLLNRRAFDEALSTQMATATQTRRPLSLLVLDLDNFKQFNDTYGHPEGDKVIAATGQVIRSCIRATDLGCRYGGEEFAVILPDAGHDEAMRVAERIRKEFALTVFEPRPGEKVSKTVSVGLASLQPNDSPAALFDRADGALYAAKRMGKDRSLYG
jgi:diguanylate cyclase (GGDEF)-like protein